MPKPKPKKFVMPKTLGACADLLHDLRTTRLDLQHQADAIKPDEAATREHIIAKLPKGDRGAVGQHHKAVVEPRVICQVDGEEGWKKLYQHIVKSKDFALLNRALNDGHVKDLLEAGKKLPPGLKRFDTVVVSLTKV